MSSTFFVQIVLQYSELKKKYVNLGEIKIIAPLGKLVVMLKNQASLPSGAIRANTSCSAVVPLTQRAPNC